MQERVSYPTTKQEILGTYALSIALGTILGVSLPSASPSSSTSTGTDSSPLGLRILSACFGYVYFIAWAISFIPQIAENFKRRSTRGLSFDSIALAFVSFSSLAIFVLCLAFSDSVRQQYGQRYQGQSPPVSGGDVGFSIFAVLAEVLVIGQVAAFSRETIRLSKAVAATICAILLSWLVLVCLAAVPRTGAGDSNSSSILQWLDVVTYISYYKLALTILRYLPQLHMNWRRGSMEGFK